MAPLIFLLTSVVLAPLQCETDPIGFDGLKELFIRDGQKHGMTYSMSTDLTFIKRAAAYIRTVYEGGTDSAGVVIPAQGVDGVVALTVFEQDPNELQASEIYRGVLDFTTYSSAENGVTVRFKEPTFATALATRGDTEVDLLGGESLGGVALPAYAAVVATLHSQQTLQRFEMHQAATRPNPPTINTTDQEDSVLFFFGMDEPSFNEFDIAPFAIGPISGDAGDAVNVPFYTAKANGVHTFSFLVNTTLAVLGQVGAAIFNEIDIKYEVAYVLSGVQTIVSLISIGDSRPFRDDLGYASDAGTYALSATRTLTLNMQVGDTLSLYSETYVHDWSATGPHVAQVRYEVLPGSYIKLSANTTTQETQCPGLLVHEALERLCEAATDTRDCFYSEYYGRTDTRVPYQQNGAGAFRLLTNGFGLRGFPLSTGSAPAPGQTDTRKALSVALDAAYTGLDAIDCLGQGIEQRAGKPVVRIEPRAYFYQAATVLELGAVNELKKGVYTDWLYNQAQVGYSHWQSGAPNGLDEFNGLRTYALPLTAIKKTYTAVSTLNTAGYLIEEARRDRYAAGSTKEGKADAEPFLICVHPTPGGLVSDTTQGFAANSIGGILSADTAYNLALAPGRMLRRHGPWLRAGLSAQTTKRLLLGKTEGNAHLVSRLTTEAAAVNEFADVPVSDLAPPLVLSETYEFKVRLRRGHMARLKANPYGRISFLDGLGTRKSGYLLRAERAPQGGLTTLTLLRAAV